MDKKYNVQFHLSNNNIIEVEVSAENNELALNLAQGMLHTKGDGWVHVNSASDESFRIRPEYVTFISCYRHGMP